MIKSLEQRYFYGMKRDIAFQPVFPSESPHLELGPGNNPMGGMDFTLDLPEWNGEHDHMPFEDSAITNIYAWHFFEHLTSDGVIHTLRECQRVLRRGGTINIMVPWYRSQMAAQDLDHKSVYTERTWEMLFQNSYYDVNKKGWRLEEVETFIMGQHERNLAIFTQLVRT